MRLGVGFWSGVNPDNIDSTLQRLARIGVKGLGHIAAHDWHPEQLQRCRDAVEAQGCFIGEVTLYHCGWPLASPDPISAEKPANPCLKACAPPAPSTPTASASASLPTVPKKATCGPMRSGIDWYRAWPK